MIALLMHDIAQLDHAQLVEVRDAFSHVLAQIENRLNATRDKALN